jgi:hypothetical protein
MDKKEGIAYSNTGGEMKAMTMMMGENQSSQSQVHVAVFQGTED